MDEDSKQQEEVHQADAVSTSTSDSSTATAGAQGGLKKRNKKNGSQKSEPANPFGHFLKQKRARDGKVNFASACVEWKEMGTERKSYYRKCFEEEKAAMGDRYRRASERGKAKVVRKSEKQSSKNSKLKQQQEVGNPSGLQLLSKVQFLDSEIEKLHLEATNLQELLCGEKVQLSLSQFKLDEKTIECSNMKDKYKSLLAQHSSCLL
jgi:hypothetical protein